MDGRRIHKEKFADSNVSAKRVDGSNMYISLARTGTLWVPLVLVEDGREVGLP